MKSCRLPGACGNNYEINPARSTWYLRKTITHSQFTAGYINRYAERLELRNADWSWSAGGIHGCQPADFAQAGPCFSPGKRRYKWDWWLGFAATSRRFDLPFLSRLSPLVYPDGNAPRPLAQNLAEKFMFPESPD
jgi:hypothetical protein